MKKSLLLLSMLVMHLFSYAQGTEQMVFQNDFQEAASGLGNLTAMFLDTGGEWTWPDRDGNEGAIIRIKVTDMSLSEMKKLDFGGSPNIGIGRKEFLEKEHQWMVAVAAGSNMFLTITHPTYGTSTRLPINQTLKARSIYDVTLVNNKTTTISVNSVPEGADVYLDGDFKGKTQLDIAGQRFGPHTLKLMYQGNTLIQTIEVEEGHTTFDKFDFRERKKVDIMSDPSGAAIYVDGLMIGKSPITGYEMVLGAHTFKAVYNAEQIDEISLNITKSSSEVVLHPIKKGNVHVTTKYGGRPVDATVVVDNEKNFSGKQAYDILLPYGKHDLRVSVYGKVKEKSIRVNKPEMKHEFNISAKNDFVWPWQREYDAVPLGLSVAYVQKQMVTDGNGEKLKENGVWDDGEDKWLRGFQVGIRIQPCLSFGLGLSTGLFYELYLSSNDKYDYKKFQEHNIYVPVHALFRLPFSEKFAISLSGGLGFNYAVYGAYTGDNLESKTDFYGEPAFAKRFNMAAEVGLGIRFKSVQLNAVYAKGITNHKSYDSVGPGYDTNVNKLSIGISYVFGSK